MSWIKTINYEDARGTLKKLYERVKGPNNNIDNVLMIHSLRPHTLKGHMVLYKNVLHNANNQLPKWYLEALGVYTSQLNKCDYCVTHHKEGLKKLIDSNLPFPPLEKALLTDQPATYFEGKWLQGMHYAKRLTQDHASLQESDIEKLRKSGFTDGEILEVNQVVSYFNYVNRMVVGLGVNTRGDILGLSPGDNDDPDNWSHK